MLTSETLRRIRYIELKTRRLVENAFAGAYHTAFKGRGIAFDSVRPYEFGDDVRDIDWNITARMGEPYIKQYVEERELTVMIVLDGSASFLFGTVNRRKRDVAAELGAVIAFSAITNNDKVGMLIHSDQVETYIAPRKGRKHVLRLIRDLLAGNTVHRGTDLVAALQTANRVLRRQSIVFLVSDFMIDHEAIAQELYRLCDRHDVIAVVTHDPLERRFADMGLVTLEDAETGRIQRFDTSQRHWRREYQQEMATFQDSLDSLLKKAQVDRIDLSPDEDFVPALTAFFQNRVRRVQR
jgi:uncharacterized protein (DUF58 family)